MGEVNIPKELIATHSWTCTRFYCEECKEEFPGYNGALKKHFYEEKRLHTFVKMTEAEKRKIKLIKMETRSKRINRDGDGDRAVPHRNRLEAQPLAKDDETDDVDLRDRRGKGE
ncbi:hypothetical protein QE152_g25330 [Popillia japonica]|uniref:C2H2-type domain-containing protein n=1 Tax=Popillia japonica TaxID=7064 RepID=A0AAW1K326_POPJA